MCKWYFVALCTCVCSCVVASRENGQSGTACKWEVTSSLMVTAWSVHMALHYAESGSQRVRSKLP